MKVSVKKTTLFGLSMLANFQFLISNFYTIFNFSMSKIRRLAVALFGSLNIENLLEIRNLKLLILGVLKKGIVEREKFSYRGSLI